MYALTSLMGSPEEARTSEAWTHEHRAEYLDYANTGNPGTIGTFSAYILVFGRGVTFQKAEPILRVLDINLNYKAESSALLVPGK